MTKRKELKKLLIETKKAYQEIDYNLEHFEDIFQGELLQWIIKNVKVKKPTKRGVLRLWKRWEKVVCGDQNDYSIDLENNLIEEIEKCLPFESKEEHQKWLDIGMGFKCWEDFEDYTMRIIERLK
jgi:hypothetical protein